jgi:hypothetical protein
MGMRGGNLRWGWETEKRRWEQGKNERDKEKEGKKEEWHGDASVNKCRIRNATIRPKNGKGVQDTRVVSQWERQKKDANEEK